MTETEFKLVAANMETLVADLCFVPADEHENGQANISTHDRGIGRLEVIVSTVKSTRINLKLTYTLRGYAEDIIYHENGTDYYGLFLGAANCLQEIWAHYHIAVNPPTPLADVAKNIMRTYWTENAPYPVEMAELTRHGSLSKVESSIMVTTPDYPDTPANNSVYLKVSAAVGGPASRVDITIPAPSHIPPSMDFAGMNKVLQRMASHA